MGLPIMTLSAFVTTATFCNVLRMSMLTEGLLLPGLGSQGEASFEVNWIEVEAVLVPQNELPDSSYD